MNIQQIISDIESRFVSLNSIPVERASIRASEWAVLMEVLSKHRSQELLTQIVERLKGAVERGELSADLATDVLIFLQY